MRWAATAPNTNPSTRFSENAVSSSESGHGFFLSIFCRDEGDISLSRKLASLQRFILPGTAFLPFSAITRAGRFEYGILRLRRKDQCALLSRHTSSPRFSTPGTGAAPERAIPFRAVVFPQQGADPKCDRASLHPAGHQALSLLLQFLGAASATGRCKRFLRFGSTIRRNCLHGTGRFSGTRGGR